MSQFKFEPKKHHRRSIRLQGYDYSPEGAYYVTIVTYHRDCLFGEIVNKEMILNDLGKIANECWPEIPQHFPFVELGAYVVMPNHVHGIIVINDDRRNNFKNLWQVQYQPSSAHIKPPSRATSVAN